MPRPGEFGNETWLKDSWSYSGNAGVWASMSGDEELGYVYLPIETPTGDFYGGTRPGNNLFAESLVCLDAQDRQARLAFPGASTTASGTTTSPRRRSWPTSPSTAAAIKAIAQISKQAFVYVLDRVTGQPVWPIEERPVPKGDVPGEWYSPTQPFPTQAARLRPAGRHASTISSTSRRSCGRRRIEIISKYKYGPLFTPFGVPGTPTGQEGHDPDAGLGRRQQLARRRPRSGDRHPLRAVGPRAGHRRAGQVGAPGLEHAATSVATRSGAGVRPPGPQGLPIRSSRPTAASWPSISTRARSCGRWPTATARAITRR